MKTFLQALIVVPIAVIAILFAVANRHLVTISFDPFNTETPAFALSAPLFLAIILMIMAGVFIGGVATWVTQGGTRSALRVARSENDKLRRDLQDTRLSLDLARREPPANSGGSRALAISGKRDAA